jgi:hypothetical protein
MRTFYALILPAAVALIAPAPARADELKPPYVCKEWVHEPDWADYERYGSGGGKHILFTWVDGWLEGYKAAHPEAERVLSGQLWRFLDEFCAQYQGTTLVEALKRADFAALEAEASERSAINECWKDKPLDQCYEQVTGKRAR